MRYGENPHQWAAFYATGDKRPGVATATQVQGKSAQLQQPQRHRRRVRADLRVRPRRRPRSRSSSTPIPAASPPAPTSSTAYQRALATDPTSAFGGIVALNGEIDAAVATEIVKIFTEVIVAPSATDEAQGDHRGEEEPAPAADRRPRRPQGRRPHGEVAGRRPPRPDPRQPQRRRHRAQGRDQEGADRGRARRPQARDEGRQAREVERDHLRARTARPSASARAR